MKALLFTAITLATPAVAQAPDWKSAKPLYLTMTGSGYQPRSLTLRRGQPYVLHVRNVSNDGHNLTQESFFRFARVAPGDRIVTQGGKIVLDSHTSVAVRFFAPMTRPGGMYQFSSTVLGDAGKDYTGRFYIR